MTLFIPWKKDKRYGMICYLFSQTFSTVTPNNESCFHFQAAQLDYLYQANVKHFIVINTNKPLVLPNSIINNSFSNPGYQNLLKSYTQYIPHNSKRFYLITMSLILSVSTSTIFALKSIAAPNVVHSRHQL